MTSILIKWGNLEIDAKRKHQVKVNTEMGLIVLQGKQCQRLRTNLQQKREV